MANTYKQLAQARENSTSAVTVYTPSAEVIIKKIRVCNTSGTAATFRLFHDTDGSTYDETTALVWDKTIAANDFFDDTGTFCDDALNSGTIGYRSSVANALTITFYGLTKA